MVSQCTPCYRVILSVMIRVSVSELWVLLLVSVWVYLLVHIHVVGGKVTSCRLVHSTLDQVVQVKALARKIELCCWVRHFTLAVPLSTKVYKWVSVNVVLEVTLQWTNIPSSGEQKILVIASCHKTGISLMSHMTCMYTLPYALQKYT